MIAIRSFNVIAIVTIAVSMSIDCTFADIKRWDNGATIQGTEGITPGPDGRLRHRDLQYANLAMFDLTRTSFASSNLSHAAFTDSALTDADFADANVFGAGFTNTTSRGFTKSQLYATSSYHQKNLGAMGLSANDLTEWDFNGQQLSGAVFQYATVTRADFRNAKLANAKFIDSTLSGADFTGAQVNGALFDGVTALGFTRDQLYATSSYANRQLQNEVDPKVWTTKGLV